MAAGVVVPVFFVLSSPVPGMQGVLSEYALKELKNWALIIWLVYSSLHGQ